MPAQKSAVQILAFLSKEIATLNVSELKHQLQQKKELPVTLEYGTQKPAIHVLCAENVVALNTFTETLVLKAYSPAPLKPTGTSFTNY